MTEDYDDDEYWNFHRWIRPIVPWDDYLMLVKKKPLWFWEM